MTFDLLRESTNFAQAVQDMLDAVLPVDPRADIEHRRLNVIKQDPWYVIRPGTQRKLGAIHLLSGGDHVANLSLTFKCGPDRASRYLAVRKSSFQLQWLGEGPPLMRLDFDHKAHTVPVAHWNVHAERGATSVLLARCNPKHVGLLSKVHLPVGGTRYRPCLEDFLEMIIKEFRFDTNPKWSDAIRAGRASWRVKQAKSIVRDLPDIAVQILENEIGYTITPPTSGHPARNAEVLHDH
ncbi:hypothetical protein ACFWQL_12125 [Amycolatopsis thermoflava]|uniref:hypothetical protein n=1 Tax=Amycolatopsis thermoflava TaxID=84480 RepID=UPI00365BB37D